MPVRATERKGTPRASARHTTSTCEHMPTWPCSARPQCLHACTPPHRRGAPGTDACNAWEDPPTSSLRRSACPMHTSTPGEALPAHAYKHLERFPTSSLRVSPHRRGAPGRCMQDLSPARRARRWARARAHAARCGACTRRPRPPPPRAWPAPAAAGTPASCRCLHACERA